MIKRRIVLILVLLIAIISVLFFIGNIEFWLAKSLKLNREIKTFDREERLNGKYIKLEKGIVLLEGNYLHGSAEGIFKTYYPNGKIKEKTFYKNNKAFGATYGYYEDGNLNYKIYNLNGLYGDSFHFDENGQMDVYGANDIRHSFFYYSTYKDLTPVNMLGSIFSENIYSYNKETREQVMLIDNAELQSGVDLFITVARPPQLFVKLLVEINGKKWLKSNPKSSIVLLKDVFIRQGEHNISISAELMDKNGNLFKSDSLKISVYKR